MKLSELTEERLICELIKWDLPTSGDKTQMQVRLLYQLAAKDINPLTYEFPNKPDMSGFEAKSNINFNSMFASMMAKMEEVSKEVKANNEKILTQMNAKFSIISDDLEKAVGATNKKLSEIFVAINLQNDTMAEKLSNLKKEGESKFDYVDQKLRSLEAKIESLQNVKEISGKRKAPSFDGSTPVNIFKFQFEIVADKNEWNMDDKGIELILALKGDAAKVLETVPLSCRNSYEDIMAALLCKYSENPQKQVNNVQLRIQKPNESLQEFALEIERLGQLAYPKQDNSLCDDFKTVAFINGILDPEVKSAVSASTGLTFTQTVSFALEQEKARANAKPPTDMVHSLDAFNIVSEFTDFKQELTDIKNEVVDNVKFINHFCTENFKPIKKIMRKETTKALSFIIDFTKPYTGESVNELLKHMKEFAQLDDTKIKIRKSTPNSGKYTVSSPVRPTEQVTYEYEEEFDPRRYL